jgi:hypothetical protein
MNNVLGLEFIKFFHKETAHLEDEGPRLLHVDCHASHINLPLIDFARDHNIVVFGYPPHTTHLLQGLDVVLFSPFKNAYARHAAEHLKQTGREVGKGDFLTVLHSAVEDSFTESNILMAWKKTGLRPIDPSVISEMDLAPSMEFSTTRALPLPPPSPIRAIVDAIHRQNAIRDTPPADQSPVSPIPSLPTPPTAKTTQEPTCDTDAIPTTPSTPVSLALLPLVVQPPPLAFPTTLPDPVALLASQSAIPPLNEPEDALSTSVTLVSEPGTTTATQPAEVEAREAIYAAGDILRGLASTRLAPLLELETVSSAIELPLVELGPLPTQLAHSIQKMDAPPSQELWMVFKNEFAHVVARTDRLLAQAVLQETYCQQVQQKLAVKEQTRKASTLQKVSGLTSGNIFTSNEAHVILVADAAQRDAVKSAAELKAEATKLKKEANAWKESALLRQKIAHTTLIAAWEKDSKATRSRRQPAKPALDPVPPQYKEALKPKKRKARKRAVSSDESERDDDPDASYH